MNKRKQNIESYLPFYSLHVISSLICPFRQTHVLSVPLLLKSVLFIQPTVTNHNVSVCFTPLPLFFCVIYTRLEQTSCLFSWRIDCYDHFVFSSPHLFSVPAKQSLLLSVLTDWLSPRSIPKVRLLAIDKWPYNSLPPSIVPLCSLPLLFPLYLPLLNLSLTSFHLQPPLSPSTV